MVSVPYRNNEFYPCQISTLIIYTNCVVFWHVDISLDHCGYILSYPSSDHSYFTYIGDANTVYGNWDTADLERKGVLEE